MNERKALIERLKAKERATLRDLGENPHHIVHINLEQLREIIAALSAEPSPDAAQGGEGEAVRLFLREYQKEIKELTAKAERAEDKGYDDAVNTIEEGFSALLAALGLPPEEGDGMDAAPAWIISQVLKQIAEGLAPLKITRDEDNHEYRVAAQGGEQGEVEIPENLIRNWFQCSTIRHHIDEDGEYVKLRALYIAKQAIEWDRQNRASHPSQAGAEAVEEAVASIETPPEVKGRVMSEMFWKGVYALQSALSRLASK